MAFTAELSYKVLLDKAFIAAGHFLIDSSHKTWTGFSHVAAAHSQTSQTLLLLRNQVEGSYGSVKNPQNVGAHLRKS